MISVTTTSAFDGYRVTATKGTAQGETFEDMLRHAETLGANAIVEADFDNALGGGTLFHGTAVQVEPIPIPSPPLKSKEGSIFEAPSRTQASRGPK